jgi:chromosomal replication initiation ATPase DnaA
MTVLCGCGRDPLAVPIDEQECPAPVESRPRLTPNRLPARVQLIVSEVSEFYGVTPADLLRHTRTQPADTARRAAMRLTRELTNLSFPDIGRCFDREHATVIGACRSAEVPDELRDRLAWIA